MSDDELPPLEDASDFVNKIKSRRDEKNRSVSNAAVSSRELLDIEEKANTFIPNLIKSELNIAEDSKIEESKAEDKTKAKKPKTKSFGGFQAGFLSGGTKKKTKPKEEPIEEIITPKARESARKENPLLLPEVQAQMKNELEDERFLSSYESDEKLMKQMADPRFARAIEFMQRDPAACKEYYARHDPAFFADFIAFFQENMKRIGGHLESKQTETKSDEQKQMEDIIERPEVKRALTDPEIQKLIHELKSQPQEASKRLSRLNPSSRSNIDVLVRNGLLQFQS